MDQIFIYRITHVQNLNFILTSGKIVCPNHAERDINYRAIGNNQIIFTRSNKTIPGSDSKTFRDFIAFYFGYRSIMLYNIHTGHGGVDWVDQREIVYLVYDISQIGRHGYSFFYTDGHALQHPVTRFFTDINSLHEVNLIDANAVDFSARADLMNPGLKRRKQAEFHIEHELYFDHICEIVVYDDEQRAHVLRLLKNFDFGTPVRVDRSYYF